MKLRGHLILSGVLFIIVGVIHLLRALFQWQFVIGNFEVPISWSFVAFLLLGFLAISSFRILGEKSGGGESAKKKRR